MSLLAFRSLNSIARRAISVSRVACTHGDMGSGVGKGGGSGGSVREAGGKFGEMEAAQEGAYFRNLERRQLEGLKKHHDDEIRHHEEEIQRHLDSIKRHREKMTSLSQGDKKKGSDSD